MIALLLRTLCIRVRVIFCSSANRPVRVLRNALNINHGRTGSSTVLYHVRHSLGKLIRGVRNFAAIRYQHPLALENMNTQSPSALENTGDLRTDIHSRPSSSNKRRKRFQAAKACAACRVSKTRCVPVDGSLGCTLCLKSKQACVMPGPKKPRTTSAQKYADLERKIDVLTSTLAAKSEKTQELDMGRAVQTETAFNPKERDQDVIEKGIIGHLPATILYEHWSNQMQPIMPFPGTTQEVPFEQLRSKKPLLLLAILTVASSSLMPDLLSDLVKQSTDELANRVYPKWQPSEELIQVLLLFSYHPVLSIEHAEFTFTQHAHMACIMAFDLGLDMSGCNTFPPSFEANVLASRTWLTCFHAHSS